MPGYNIDKRAVKTRNRIGHPRYKVEDTVHFLLDRGNNQYEKHKGIINIVDAYGTLGQHEEPSYDMFINEKGSGCLCKHIRESHCRKYREKTLYDFLDETKKGGKV